jgi:hypothetical protein
VVLEAAMQPEAVKAGLLDRHNLYRPAEALRGPDFE